MELDRSHLRNTSSTSITSEPFICFSSRLSSSSSMKLTKSIPSPGRVARNGGPVSLSSSLSRRLRTNGSLKGGASPFFANTAKKRGCGFENPEPSSPKVTCIGQVRVKTKKKVRQQTRSLSRRRSEEVRFRKIEQGEEPDLVQRNEEKTHSHIKPQNQECFPQRWAHLPISICEGLRSISCFSSEGGKCEEMGDENGNGCGVVFTRWLVSVNNGENGRRREIELVVGGGDDEQVEVEEMRVSIRRSSKRHVFDDFEVKDDRIEVKGQAQSYDVKYCEEEKARVCVCVPPKNALLLMRCRSDPMKVAALASRFSWDARAAAAGSNCENDGDVEEMEEVSDGNKEFVRECERENEIFVVKGDGSGDFEQGVDASVECNEKQAESIQMEDDGHEELIVEELVVFCENMVEDERDELNREIGEVYEEETLVEQEEGEEVESNMSSFEDLLDQENADQHYEDCPIQENERVVAESPIHDLFPSTESKLEEDIESSEVQLHPEEATLAKLKNDATIDEEYQIKPEPEEPKPNKASENQELGILNEEPQKENGSPLALPDCLLLMMCEPKLSMEVSKETWVCRTDFIRWLPERPPKQQQAKPTKASAECNHEPAKRRLSMDAKPKQLEKMINILHQPAPQQMQLPRSSCSLPPKAASMATMIEQKLVNVVAYEPFVLTRCKPMRMAAAKLMPDSFYWKNAMRKLEPHRRATVGAAAAGISC